MTKLFLLLTVCSFLLMSVTGMVPSEKNSGVRKSSETLGKDSASTNTITLKPVNTAVDGGNPITMSCTSNTSPLLSWFFWPIGATTNYIVVIGECEVNPNYADRIEVAPGAGFGKCDLTVKSAAATDAGTYACFQTSDVDHSEGAQLAVITGETHCRSNASADANLFEFEYVEHYCSVNYTNNIADMLINWIDETGEPVMATEDFHVPGFTASRIILQASPPTLRVFHSFTYFRTPSGLPSGATNTPVYNSTWFNAATPVKLRLMIPEDTTAAEGSYVNMTCRRRSQDIAWTFIPRGQSQSHLIVGSPCRVVPAFVGNYTVDNTLDACHLIIDPLAPHHQGIYTCQDVFDPSGDIFPATLLIG